MMLDYFYGQSGELFAYYRIPKALFQDSRFRQLSTDARTLYGILLDRMSLSAKNSWVDEHGRVYIIYTVREVQESLCCAEHKAVKLFRELEQADLVERKRRGLGRPSLIYVKNFSSGLPKAQIQNCANSNSCAAESAVQVRPKSQSNKTDMRRLRCGSCISLARSRKNNFQKQFVQDPYRCRVISSQGYPIRDGQVPIAVWRFFIDQPRPRKTRNVQYCIGEQLYFSG